MFRPKHYLKQCWHNWLDPLELITVNIWIGIELISIQEMNVKNVVCIMVAILSQPQCIFLTTKQESMYRTCVARITLNKHSVTFGVTQFCVSGDLSRVSLRAMIAGNLACFMTASLAGECRTYTLRWRHNLLDGVSNHQPHDCLLNRFIRALIKENI